MTDTATMSRSRLWLAHAVIVTVIAGHVLAIVADTEFWPFSAYPMFSYAPPGRAYERLQVFAVPAQGPEFPLRDPRQLAPVRNITLTYTFAILTNRLREIREFSDARYDNHFSTAQSRRRVHGALAQILRLYGVRRAAGRHKGPPLRAVRLYRIAWRDFRPATLRTPDERVLLAEVVSGADHAADEVPSR